MRVSRPKGQRRLGPVAPQATYPRYAGKLVIGTAVPNVFSIAPYLCQLAVPRLILYRGKYSRVYDIQYTYSMDGWIPRSILALLDVAANVIDALIR